MGKHSAARELAEYAAARITLAALGWTPRRAAFALAELLAGCVYRLTPGWRRVARRNLALALPELSPARRKRIVRGVYSHLGRVLLAVARMPRLNPRNIGDWIEYEGFENFEQALRAGRGVLFLTAHLGNWELSAFAHALFGHPMHVMVRPLDNPWLDALLERRRTLSGNQTIRKQDSVRAIVRALRNNDAVGILADQNAAGADGVFVDFFGRKARATSGLVRIALRTGAAVLPGFALWSPERGRHVLRFYPPIEMVSTGDLERDVIANTQRCQDAIAEVIRRHPDQWLWIHRRWKTRPPGEPPLY